MLLNYVMLKFFFLILTKRNILYLQNLSKRYKLCAFSTPFFRSKMLRLTRNSFSNKHRILDNIANSLKKGQKVLERETHILKKDLDFVRKEAQYLKSLPPEQRKYEMNMRRQAAKKSAAENIDKLKRFSQNNISDQGIKNNAKKFKNSASNAFDSMKKDFQHDVNAVKHNYKVFKHKNSNITDFEKLKKMSPENRHKELKRIKNQLSDKISNLTKDQTKNVDKMKNSFGLGKVSNRNDSVFHKLKNLTSNLVDQGRSQFSENYSRNPDPSSGKYYHTPEQKRAQESHRHFGVDGRAGVSPGAMPGASGFEGYNQSGYRDPNNYGQYNEDFRKQYSAPGVYNSKANKQKQSQTDNFGSKGPGRAARRKPSDRSKPDGSLF